MKKLKIYGYPLTGANIRIFSEEANEFILFNSDPIDENVFLDDKFFDYRLLTVQAICYIEEKLILKNGFSKINQIEKK